MQCKKILPSTERLFRLRSLQICYLDRDQYFSKKNLAAWVATKSKISDLEKRPADSKASDDSNSPTKHFLSGLHSRHPLQTFANPGHGISVLTTTYMFFQAYIPTKVYIWSDIFLLTYASPDLFCCSNYHWSWGYHLIYYSHLANLTYKGVSRSPVHKSTAWDWLWLIQYVARGTHLAK